MAENLFHSVLARKIDLDTVLRWLFNGENITRDHTIKFDCLKSDFISYCCYFIQEQSAGPDRGIDTPPKTSTPSRRGQVRCLFGNDDNDSPNATKKRSLLIDSTEEESLNNTSTPQSEKTSYRLRRNSEDGVVNNVVANGDVTSTPKLTKLMRDTSLANESYNCISPISPFCNGESQHNITPKIKGNERTSRLCLGDFIVDKRSLTKKNSPRNISTNILSENVHTSSNRKSSTPLRCSNPKKSRRINPTNLNEIKTNTNFTCTENSFNFKQDFVELDNVNEQRHFFVEERMKIVSRKSSGENLQPSLSKSVKQSFLNARSEIIPSLEFVTYKDELDILILLYTALLKHSLILNLARELYLLISLLLRKQYESFNVDKTQVGSRLDDESLGVKMLDTEIDVSDTSIDKTETSMEVDEISKASNKDCEQTKISSRALFETVHNCVYFSSSVLKNNLKLLTVLDKSTLKLLAKANRLQQFLPNYIVKIQLVYEQKLEKKVDDFKDNVKSNICFISSTDNRKKFPNELSFHAFRKQRDLFYEILEIWEKEHLQPGWKFVNQLGNKIKSLLSMCREPANFIHFARLFMAQLLGACGKNNTEEEMSENQISAVLSLIPNANAEKLSRLKNRLTTKESSGGISSVPSFTGHQEFYQNFLLVAANDIFNRHLTDLLISEILELNDTSFNLQELKDESTVDLFTRQTFFTCIKSLRVLAKYLGFLESLPYANSHVVSEEVLALQIRVRGQIQPPVNLKNIIIEAITKQTLILTIPWVVKYIAMLDYVTQHLPYYKEVFNLLFEIYFSCSCPDTEKTVTTMLIKLGDSEYGINTENLIIINLCLGWLFSLPHFPNELFFEWSSDKLEQKVKTLVPNDAEDKERRKAVKKRIFDGTNDFVQVQNNSVICLDRLDITDQNIFRVCCPFMEEVRKLLLTNVSSSSSATVRHITPLTATHYSSKMSKIRLQAEVEEAFFSGKPPAFKKTIEFISERITSMSVDHVRATIIPTYVKNMINHLRGTLNGFISSTDERESTRFQGLLKSEANSIAAQSLQELHRLIYEEVGKITDGNIPGAVESLLGFSILEQTKKACIYIALKMCVHRIDQWISSNVTLALFTKEIDNEVQKITLNHLDKIKDKCTHEVPTFVATRRHNLNTLGTVELFEEIRTFSLNLLEKTTEVTLESVKTFLNVAYTSIFERNDFIEIFLTTVYTQLLDFSILLIAQHPHIASNAWVITKLISIWKEGNCDGEVFDAVVSPRNILLLSQSENGNQSWETFASFLCSLLTQQLLTSNDFESQCVLVHKEAWDEVTLGCFSNCIQTIIDHYAHHSGSKFSCLTNFMTDNNCVDLHEVF